MSQLKSIMLSAVLFSGLYGQDYQPPSLEKLDEYSRIIIKQSVDFNNPSFDCIKSLFYDSDKTIEKMEALQGQIIQHKNAALKEWGVLNKDKVTLVGSKSLPGLVKVVYMVDAKIYPLPLSILWLNRNGSYYVCGIAWGSQVNQDLSDLSQKNPGVIVEFKN